MTKSSNNNIIRLRLVLVVVVVIVTILFPIRTTSQQLYVVQPPLGIQTGPDIIGSSFASSISYDIHSHSIIITGSTFGQYFSSTTTTDDSSSGSSTTPPQEQQPQSRSSSNCFIATIGLPDVLDELNYNTGGSSSSSPKLQWSTKQVLGDSTNDKMNQTTVHESCTMALYHPQNKDKVFILGYSEVGGHYDTLYDDATLDPVQHYGILLDIDIINTDDDTSSSSSSTTTNQPYRIIGGRAIQEYSVTYPILAVLQNDIIYVISQETDTLTRSDVDSANNQFVDSNTNTVFDIINNEVDPMRFFKHGDKYGMSLRQYRSYPLVNHDSNENNEYKITFEEGWSTHHIASSTTLNTITNRNITSSESAHVAGLAIVDDILIAVGSTSGDGTAFGRSDSSSSSSSSSSSNTILYNDSTLHGFVTKFYKSNGTVVISEWDDNNDSDGSTVKGTRRIQSSTEGGRVWVAGMCYDHNKEPDAIYIVGAIEGLILTENNAKFAPGSSTTNTNGVDAYVIKMDVTTLDEIWIQQITGIDPGSMVRGISCAIATNEDAIWIGGVVQNDGVIVHADTISSYGGDDIFIVKLNSMNGEHILTRQIGSTEDDGLAMRGGITLDRDDNCIVVGNTYGSLYRVRSEEEIGDIDDENRLWISDIFVTTIGKDGTMSYPISHPDYIPQPGSGSTGEGVDAVLPPQIETSSEEGLETSTIVVLIVIFLICGSFAVVLYVRNRSKFNRDASTDRSKVILFLNEFDVDDIDLKHSATGGWHCSYSNDLANGHNRRILDHPRTPSFGALSPLPGDKRSSSFGGSDPLLTAPLTSRSLIKESLFMNDDDDDNNSSFGDGNNRFTESTTSSSTNQRPGYTGLLDDYINNSGLNDRSTDDDRGDVWGKEIL